MTKEIFDANDSILAVSNFAFDIAFLELILPLTIGAKTILLTDEDCRNGEVIIKTLESSGATMMQATPSTWKLLMQNDWKGIPYLKSLVGGELLPIQLAQSIRKRCKVLWNLYGPTEATIWSSAYLIPKEISSVSIGCPIDNTQMYILDKHLSPTPIGIPGDLYIGGKNLSSGYLNRPELNAEKFIPNPFIKDTVIYQTGDLAYYKDDGNIYYVDRADNQVKIRGHRIEMSEIEAHLSKNALVKEVVVIDKTDKYDNKYLSAYVIVNEQKDRDEEISLTDLKNDLAKKLPKYMIPEQFIQINNIPLSPNGKIDRKQLMTVEQKMIADSHYDPPRNQLEETMVKIWEEVLDFKPIGITNSFFDLGGHSLKAIELIAKMKEKQIDISLNDLFQFQTIIGLAECALLKESDLENNNLLFFHFCY